MVTAVPNSRGVTLLPALDHSSASFKAHRYANDGRYGTINFDINGPCAAGATLTGANRLLASNQRVVVRANCSHGGTLVVETTIDGVTWPASISLPLRAGETFTGTFQTTNGHNDYRVRFISPANQGNSTVRITTQYSASFALMAPGFTPSEWEDA